MELSNEDLAKRIDEKRAKSLYNGHKQKVVSMKEVESMIEQG
ncbi:MAG: hypothetical protein QW292_09045 [Candidatus Parvarchaeota archaeon]